MKKYQVVLIIVGLIVAALLTWYFGVKRPNDIIKSINSFESCGKYYPVMESYPAQCVTPDGRHFIQPTTTGTTQIANPASTYCIEHGGKLSIIEEEPGMGGQVGMCTLPSGKVCEEWTFFRGECQ